MPLLFLAGTASRWAPRARASERLCRHRSSTRTVAGDPLRRRTAAPNMMRIDFEHVLGDGLIGYIYRR